MAGPSGVGKPAAPIAGFEKWPATRGSQSVKIGATLMHHHYHHHMMKKPMMDKKM
jgi:hypothetical protein